MWIETSYGQALNMKRVENLSIITDGDRSDGYIYELFAQHSAGTPCRADLRHILGTSIVACEEDRTKLRKMLSFLAQNAERDGYLSWNDLTRMFHLKGESDGQ